MYIILGDLSTSSFYVISGNYCVICYSMVDILKSRLNNCIQIPLKWRTIHSESVKAVMLGKVIKLKLDIHF